MAASALVLQPSPVENFKASAASHIAMFQQAPIQVFIATVGQQSPSMVPLEVSKSDTIASLKIRIQAHGGFFIDQQRLVFGGKELTQDDKMLRDYGVDHGDILHLFLRLSDFVSLTVKTADGSSFLYKVLQQDDLKDLKAIESGGYDASAFDVAVLMGENVGDNPSVFEELVLRGEAVLCLRVHRPSIRSKSWGKTGLELVISSRMESTMRMSRNKSFPDVISRTNKNVDPETFNIAAHTLQKEDERLAQCSRLVEKSSQFRSHSNLNSLSSDSGISSYRELSQSAAHQCNGSPTYFQAKKENRPPGTNRFPSLQIGKFPVPRSPVRLLLPRKPISFELSPRMQYLLYQCEMGLSAGHSPVLTSEGSGGVYLMRNESGMQNVAVFKPVDEEPFAVNNPRGFFYGSVTNSEPSLDRESERYEEGLKKGTKSGKGALREVAAYILDHPMIGVRALTRKDVVNRESEGFAGVPPTLMVKCYHDAFHYSSRDDRNQRKLKIGSLQQFVHAISSCEDMGASMFSVDEVHKITILDMRIANTDRNGGNILVQKGADGALKLVPIDHGYCLPEKFEDCTFEWLYWPQAQKPYGALALEYIKSLDADKDIALLRDCGWTIPLKSARILRISTMLLKKGVLAGLTPFQIGSIMSRVESPDVKSPIECILQEAETVDGRNFLDVVSYFLDEYIASVKRQ